MNFLVFLGHLVFVTSIIRSEKGVAGADDFRYLTGYAGLNQTGAHYQFTEYMPDLSVVQMDNTIESSCGVGYWLLYDEVDYDPLTNETECHFRPYECGNWSPQCQNMVSSLRYAGSPYGLNDDYYNLYEGTIFRGKEFRGNTNAADLGDLDMAVSSLIVTGQSAWTFYTDVNLTGSDVCVYADEHYTYGTIDLDYALVQDMEKLGLPDNSIRSVARGCLSDRVLGQPGGERRSQDASN
ncbi:uncharacterized protein LOC108665176 isoform X2 [Hyalella azteca]|uniref:Uncharacterized protein LOC108665176 isoform X2 n=1 Tax=Hyalella azteca TaxID=294128 RepID=A0A8B7N1R0_HYAAZ|nr:uncharacterized protein LOC108665176 isoform X2 [Hyalella azteca]